ncbi:hypothetical protein ACLX1H_006173 [Fusarium chlamydosporum]
MSDEQRPIPLSPEGSDVVIIGNDDISNYNPECILPEPEDTIASIREWLRPTEYSQESGEYHKHLTFHLEGTGEWLNHSENYRRWHESSKDGLLWIKGVPGSGKSVAAANIIHRLSKEQVPVLYFFFRQIIDANHRPINLLRDWLDQILLFCPELQSVLKTYVDTSRSLDSVSIDELWRHLKVALSSITRVYCVADALDEMDEGNSEFVTQLAELGHLRPSSVKVLLTSRPTANVEAAMRGVDFLNIRMEEALVDIDIATYVRHCLAITSISEGDQQIIKETVPGRANGLFLYAKLAMKAFLEPGASIQDTIRTLPLDLDAMYIDILREHARRTGISDKTQVMILQWVTHATRPLRLLELADMLGTAVAGRVSRTLKEDKDLVRAACGPLLEILPDETVSVVHHSLTEFLVGAARTGRPDGYPVLDPSGADVNEKDSVGRSAIHSTECSDTFKYLLEAGADPAAQLKDGRTVLHCLPQDADEGYLKLLVESRNNGIDEREYRKGRTPLLSAIRSHSALAIPLLQYGSDCTIADFKGNGPLHYVFSYHNSQISPVPSRSICIDNTRDGSKIPKLVKALLEAGADPKLANCDGETPLHFLVAACYVDDRDLGYLQEAIELLLHHGADINAKDAKGRTPFFRLAGRRFKSGQETTDFFKLFIEQSASLNTRDYEGRTLLHEAIYRISWEAKTRGMSTLSYEYLVDAGVSPSIPDFKGNTICHELILAPDCSRLKGMAKTFFPLFRNGGVETDKPNFSGTTPLQVACQMRIDDEHDGNKKAQDCLVWLLENSSDPDASDTRGLRAIHFAASTDTYTVDRLLRAGADPFATTHQGMNVLHIAARCKRSNSIGLLLERMNELSPEAKKMALNQKDVCQYTPLHYACRSGIIESVWLLIEAGADVNPTFDNSQETYLDEPWFPPILQCAFFRLENSLWRRKPTVPYPSSVGPGWRNAADHPDVPRGYNLIAGGYTVEDTSRHFDKTIPERQLSQLKIFDHAIDVSRYEGIVNALIAAGADVSQYGHGSTSYLYHAILFAADRLDDYATNLLGEMSKKIDHHAFLTPTHVSITLMKAHRQAEIAVLRDFFLPRAKETTWETVGRLLSERQFSLIKELNRAGADFTTRSARGVSIMHRLVEYGFYELVDDCYRPQEVSPPNDGEQISGNTTTDTKPLLMVACKRSTPNMEVIRVLVEKKGVDINAKDRSGLTALHYLATGRYWWQYSQAIPYLVSAGADLEAQNMDRQTPLLYSCVRKGTSWTAAVKTLIDLGADVKVVSRKGFSCLRYAAKDEALVRLLVSHGADVLPMDIIQAIKEHQAEVLRILLLVNEPLSLATSWKLKLEDAKEMDLDANPVQTDLIREGHPLFVASTTFMPVSDISTNDKRSVLGKMMKNLIATGFSPYDTCLSRIEKFRAPHRSSLPTGVAIQSWYKKESDSEMMFHSLNVFYSKPEGLADRVVMHQILSSGQGYYQPILELPDLDLEFRDGSGETLLLAACQRGPPRKAKEDRLPLRLLLERGVDSFAVDYHGRNAMHHKLGSRALNDEKLEAIKDLGDAVPHLINQTDAYGFRPLHYGLAAVVHGETNQTEPDWVDYIISQGADMLIADALGNNALHYLASGVLGCLCYTGSNTKDLFEKFLALGLEINSRNNAGQTLAFFLATNVARKKATNAIEDHLDEVMSWLDSLGVDWHVKDELNRNILHEIAGESVKLFKAVMDQGVDPLAEDIDGRTSLDLAAAHGNGDVLKLFDREAKM